MRQIHIEGVHELDRGIAGGVRDGSDRGIAGWGRDGSRLGWGIALVISKYALELWINRTNLYDFQQ